MNENHVEDLIAERALPPRPEKPQPYECCNRGCERCIFVYYYEAVERWEALTGLKIEDP